MIFDSLQILILQKLLSITNKTADIHSEVEEEEKSELNQIINNNYINSRIHTEIWLSLNPGINIIIIYNLIQLRFFLFLYFAMNVSCRIRDGQYLILKLASTYSFDSVSLVVTDHLEVECIGLVAA